MLARTLPLPIAPRVRRVAGRRSGPGKLAKTREVSLQPRSVMIGLSMRYCASVAVVLLALGAGVALAPGDVPGLTVPGSEMGMH